MQFYLRKKATILSGMLFLIFFCFCDVCVADSNLACSQLRIAFYEDGALFYHNTKGEFLGIDKDVIDELQRRTACFFRTSVDSRVRIWAQLRQGTLDLSVSGIATKEREKFTRFIPYFSTRNFAILRKNLPPESQSAEGFLAYSQLRVGVVKGFQHGETYEAWLAQMRSQGRVEEVGDFETVIRLFRAHRIDAMLALPTGMLPLQAPELREQFVIKDWVPTETVNFSLVISKANVSDELAVLFEKTIADMRKDGCIEAILHKHLGPDLMTNVHNVN